MRQAGHVAAGAACLFVFAVMALGVTGAWDVAESDIAMASQVANWHSPALTNIMLVITSLGDGVYLTFLGALVVVALSLRRAWLPAFTTATAFLLLPVLVSAIKAGFARTRPTADLYSGVDAFSFPSGHAANSILIYGTVAVLAFLSLKGRTKWLVGIGFALLGILVTASRVYVAAHWASDSLAGLALGGIVLSGLAWVLSRPSHTPVTPRIPLLVLACFALTAPLYAWYVLPFARTFYAALA